MCQRVNLFLQIAVYNAGFVFHFVFVVGTKIIFGYNFGAPLNTHVKGESSFNHHVLTYQKMYETDI